MSAIRFFCCVLLLFSSALHGQTRVEFHLLPAVSTGPLDPKWSRDGNSIVFAMRGDIWIVPAGGGEAVALTEGPAYHSEPAFRPDGKMVALTLDLGGNLDVGLVDAAGGAVERLTTEPDVDFAPAWSPDGKNLYFVSRRSGNLDVFRIDLDTRAVAPVVAGPRNDFQPAVSPDGRKLAYVSPVAARGGSGGIWVYPLEGGEPGLVHYEETSYRAKPHWSPDGAKLFYSTDVSGSNDVAVVLSSGGDRVRLTEDSPGEFDEFDPAVSPDGSQIVFVSNHQGPTALYTLSSAGGARSAWREVRITSRKPRFRAGRVRGVVRGPDGEVVPARLMLVASDGRAYTEDGGFHRMVPSTRTHFQHVSGSFEIEVPGGTTTLAAMRGFDYLPARASIDVPAGGVAEVELRLERLFDSRAAGWYSGDMHVHDLHEGRFGLTPEGFFHQLVADDVHVANALVHMDGTKIMGRFRDVSGENHRLSSEDHLLRYSQEFRGSFGHVALIGVRELIMPFIGGAPYTPYAPDVLKIRHIDRAREMGGIAGFVHPYNHAVVNPDDAASSDIAVHAALGRGDFYDVISVASREVDSASVYYKLLNCGFRLAATGGTDNFSDVWYDPSGGAARTYARLEPRERPLSYDAWIEAVRAGRTFATSGPLLFLTVEGREPGEEIRIAASDPESLEVRVEISSIVPLETVEVLLNGEVAHRWQPSGEGPHFGFDAEVELPGSGWVAARALGPSSRYVGDAHAFAQTSPIHVLRDGVTFTSAADARFLLESVEALWREVESRNFWHTEAEKEAYREEVDRAREVYRSILRGHGEE